jgi:hypothetical protein
MEAPPQQVWELVSDITNTGEFSPETFEAEWLEAPPGRRSAPGSAAT